MLGGRPVDLLAEHQALEGLIEQKAIQEKPVKGSKNSVSGARAEQTTPKTALEAGYLALGVASEAGAAATTAAGGSSVSGSWVAPAIVRFGAVKGGGGPIRPASAAMWPAQERGRRAGAATPTPAAGGGRRRQPCRRLGGGRFGGWRFSRSLGSRRLSLRMYREGSNRQHTSEDRCCG
jgi:hypothetical protein